MSSTFRYEIIRDITSLQNVRPEWNRLAATMKEGDIFHSFEWFECWYKAYCKSGSERIVLVYEGSNLRAILPGMITVKQIKGISCTVFSYAGNGHSPRCGIIAKQGDEAATNFALATVNVREVGNSFDFSILSGVMSDTDTHRAIEGMGGRYCVHVEHRYNSPSCNISDGWEVYLKSRSSSFRKNFKRYFNKISQIENEPNLEILSSEADVDESINRLVRLEEKTWQHHNGTGMFSRSDNASFYRSLLKQFLPACQFRVCFLVSGFADVAYQVILVRDNIVYALKTGYDPDFRKYSPGFLITSLLIKQSASSGFYEYDLLGETTDEKMNWATHYQEHSNYWIFNVKSSKGFLLRNALKLHAIFNARKMSSDMAVTKSLGADQG